MKEKYIDFFNSLNKGGNIDMNLLVSGVSEYLTDINCGKTSEMINLLTQHPEIVSMFDIVGKVVDHLCRKYSIKWIVYKNQIISYYGLTR